MCDSRLCLNGDIFNGAGKNKLLLWVLQTRAHEVYGILIVRMTVSDFDGILVEEASQVR